jgi:anthranilate phosphoribosyltransferase
MRVSTHAFGQMLDGIKTATEISDILSELAYAGETSADIVAAVIAMRARMIPVAAPQNAIDVCGTGGDGQHSLNVSTAVAIIVSACEVPVAKHGNRAASSKAGGADTLEALGLNLDQASQTAAATLSDLGICFLFAQKHHPALARIAPIRKALGRRTIFNLLGPLANPAGVTRQLVGVPNPKLIPLFVDAMQALGTERAMIVSGNEGLDELSISGPSEIATIGFGLASHIVTPEDAGLLRHPPEAIKGGDAAYNAAALRRLLAGETGAYRDAVLLNAAGALIVAGEVDNWRAGVEEAAEAIDKGLAKAVLDCWVAY